MGSAAAARLASMPAARNPAATVAKPTSSIARAAAVTGATMAHVVRNGQSLLRRRKLGMSRSVSL